MEDATDRARLSPRAVRRLVVAALVVASAYAVPGVAVPARAAVTDDTAPIPASVGPPGSGGFLVSTTGIPAGVPAARFVAVAQRSGERWGLRFLGVTTLAPVTGDGRNVIGFGTTTIEGAGAEATSAPISSVSRSRRCARVRIARRVRVALGGATTLVRRVRTVRRCRVAVARMRVVEHDVIIGAALAWQAGPAHPSAWQVDLETVLLHELGHVAGSDHADGCLSTPMWATLELGDWWRGPGDWHRAAC